MFLYFNYDADSNFFNVRLDEQLQNTDTQSFQGVFR